MSFANDEKLKHNERKDVEKQSQLFEDVSMIYVYFIINVITLSEKK
jgi:hypothetical protein